MARAASVCAPSTSRSGTPTVSRSRGTMTAGTAGHTQSDESEEIHRSPTEKHHARRSVCRFRQLFSRSLEQKEFLLHAANMFGEPRLHLQMPANRSRWDQACLGASWSYSLLASASRSSNLTHCSFSLCRASASASSDRHRRVASARAVSNLLTASAWPFRAASPKAVAPDPSVKSRMPASRPLPAASKSGRHCRDLPFLHELCRAVLRSGPLTNPIFADASRSALTHSVRPASHALERTVVALASRMLGSAAA